MFGFGYNVFRQISGSRNIESDGFKDVKCVDETTKVIDVPVKVDTSLSGKIVKVQSCWTNTFFLNENGNVNTFGWVAETKTLGKVANILPGEIIKDISCTANKVVFVTKEGKLLLWNDYMYDSLSPIVGKLEKSISMISCGDLQTIAVTDDGHLGQVLTDASDGNKPEPSMLFVEIPFSNHVKTVGCGKEHTLILTKNGTVFSFGGGSRGQIGNGSLDQQDKPMPVEALSGIMATMISCGGWHSAVISSSGDLYMWGWNKDGQVGVSICSDSLTQVFVQIQAVPVPVVFSDYNVVDVSCGARHTAAITSNGELWTWGFGYYGQLGHGSEKSCHKPVKVPFSTLSPTLTTKAKSVYCNHWDTFVSVKND